MRTKQITKLTQVCRQETFLTDAALVRFLRVRHVLPDHVLFQVFHLGRGSQILLQLISPPQVGNMHAIILRINFY